MDEGTLQVSYRDRRRIETLSRVRDRLLTLRAACEKLGLSYRQGKRLWKRYRDGGDSALLHRGRGVAPHNLIDAKLKAKILGRYQEAYGGFGPALACEKLVEEDGFTPVSRETLRLWLIGAGMWQRHRRRRPYRRRREPKHHFGELVQLDGSPHRWFGEEHNEYCLMNMVDDATGITLAIMNEQETTEAAMRVLWAWIQRYGIPEALYCDLRNVYLIDRQATEQEQLEGKVIRSAFGQACQKLGIQIISAHSPQAKGRVERKHGVYQDRFVKELRLRGAKTIAEANMILQGGFVEKLNKKFAHSPMAEEDFHVPLRPGQDLRDIFCIDTLRSVGRDWVVRDDNRFFQLLPGHSPLPRTQSKVVVRRWLDESIHILHRGKRLVYQEFELQQRGRKNII